MARALIIECDRPARQNRVLHALLTNGFDLDFRFRNLSRREPHLSCRRLWACRLACRLRRATAKLPGKHEDARPLRNAMAERKEASPHQWSSIPTASSSWKTAVQ